MPTSSVNIPLRQSLGIGREKITAMLDVLKSRWQTRGWHPMVKGDSEPMAIEFIRELDRHGIPWQHYRELYNRSIDLRSRRMEQGLKTDDFSVDMMIACWPSLVTELRDREIAEGRTLTSNAETQCPNCDGTGLEKIVIDGEVMGRRPGCRHEFDPSRIDEKPATSVDLERAMEAARPKHRDETDVEILRRLSSQTAYAWAQAIPNSIESSDLWNATACLRHAEQYCRQQQEEPK